MKRKPVLEIYIAVAMIFFFVAPISILAQEPPGNERPLTGAAIPDSQQSNSAMEKPKTDNQGDDELRRFEVGLQYSYLRFGTFDPGFTKEWRQIAPFPPGIPLITPENNPKESGIGARVTYNFNKTISAEAEVNWFVRREDPLFLPPPNHTTWQGGQKLQMVFGPKIGHRWKKFGVFGKARPGFIHFVEFPVVTFLQQVPPGQPFFSATAPRRATFFNVDIGGVFEYYPSKRTIIRFDVGDTIIRYNAQEPRDINPSFTRHNLQINVGFGFRF